MGSRWDCDRVSTRMSEPTTNDVVVVNARVTEENDRIDNMSGGEVYNDKATSYDEMPIASDTSTGLVSGVRQAMQWTDRHSRLPDDVHDSSEWSASLSNMRPAVASTSTTFSWMANENGRRENEKLPPKIPPYYDQHSNDRPIDYSLRTMNSVGSVAGTSKSDDTPNGSKTSVFDGRVVSDLEFGGLARQRRTHNTILRHHRFPDPVDNMFVARIRDERKRQRQERCPVESFETARKNANRNDKVYRQERRRRRYVDAIRQAQMTMDLNMRYTLNEAMSKKMALEHKFLKNAQNPIYLRNHVDREGFWKWRDDIIPLARRPDGRIEPNELDFIIRDVDPYDTESSFESETNFDYDRPSPDRQRRVIMRKTQNDRIQSVMRWGRCQQNVSSPPCGSHGGDKENDRYDYKYYDYEEGSDAEQQRSVLVSENQDVDVDWSTIGQDSSDSIDFEVQQPNTDAVNGMTSDSSLGDQNEPMTNLPMRGIKSTSKKEDKKRRSSVVAIVEPFRPFNDVENTSNDMRTSHRNQEQVDVLRSFTATAKALSLVHIELFHGLKKMTNALKKTVVAPTGSTEAAETTTPLVVPINPEITTKQNALLDDLKRILDSILKLMKNSGASNAALATSRVSNYLEESVISAERVAEEIITSDLPQATTVDYATVIRTYEELMRRINNINSSIQQFIRFMSEEMNWLVDTYEWAGEVAIVGEKVTALLENMRKDKVQENHNIPSPSLVPSLSPAQDVQESRRRYQERRIRLRQYREQNRSQQQRQPISRPPRLLESFMSNLPDRVFPHRPVEMLLNGHVTRGSYFETNQMGVTILEDGHILIIDSCMENATESRQPSAQNSGSNSIPENVVGPIPTASTLASSTLNPATTLANSTLNPATNSVSSTLNPASTLASLTVNPATTLAFSTLNPATTLAVPITVTANLNSVPISPAVTTTYTSSTTSTALNFTATDSSYFTTTSSEPIYTSPIYTSPISATHITMVNGGASTTDPQNSAPAYNRTRFTDFWQWPPRSEPLLYRSEQEPSPPPVSTADWIASPMAQVATVAANIATQRLRQRTNLFRFLRRPPPPVIVVTPATDDEEETGAERDEQESAGREDEHTQNGMTRRRFRSFSPPFNGSRASCPRWRLRSRAALRRRQHRSPPSDGDRSAVMSDEITTRTLPSSSRPPPPTSSSSSSSPPPPPFPPPPASLSPPPVALRSALPSRPTTGAADSALCHCINVGPRRWSSCADITAANDRPSPEYNHRRRTATAAAADPASNHAPSWSNASYGAGGSSGRTYTIKRSQSSTNSSSVPTRKFKFASPVRGHSSDQQQ